MKKMIMLLASMATVSVVADIEVELRNDAAGGEVYQPGGALYVDQALVQLIWTPNSPTQQAGLGGSLGAAEYLLNSLVTPLGPHGLFANQGVLTYSDGDVGGNNINVGYFFVRIFDNSALAEDDYYLQQYVQGPTLNDPTDEPPPLAYTTSGALGGTLDNIADGGGYQIIPEPAVASLIGICGVGTLFARRIFGKV